MRAVFIYFPEADTFQYRRDRRTHIPRRRPRMYGRRDRRLLAPAHLQGWDRILWLVRHGAWTVATEFRVPYETIAE